MHFIVLIKKTGLLVVSVHRVLGLRVFRLLGEYFSSNVCDDTSTAPRNALNFKLPSPLRFAPNNFWSSCSGSVGGSVCTRPGKSSVEGCGCDGPAPVGLCRISGTTSSWSRQYSPTPTLADTCHMHRQNLQKES